MAAGDATIADCGAVPTADGSIVLLTVAVIDADPEETMGG